VPVIAEAFAETFGADVTLFQQAISFWMNVLHSPANVRVAHLISHPIQYFAPLYRALAKYPISLTVFFNAGGSLDEFFDEGFDRRIRWNISLASGFDYRLSPGARNRAPSRGFDWRLDLSALREISRGNYDAVWLHGYSSLNALAAIVIGSLTNTPVFLRDDATLLTPRSSLKRAVKRLLLPLLLRKVTPFYVGSHNRAFFEYYGVRRMHPFSYAVDNERWQAAHHALRGREPAVKTTFGIEDDFPVILFCGKLINRKGPLLLLRAFEEVRRTIRCHLLYAGEGGLRNAIETAVREDSIPDVHMTGFLDQTDLPNAYAIADLLVLPSVQDEPWGLVVNEGMNFGLPIIVSTRVGCAAELVHDGSNGFVVEAGNLTALAAAISSLVGSKPKREAFGKNSLTLINSHAVDQSAQQLAHAFDLALNQQSAISKRSATSAG
jgi:glycosyltransferase involved in cell wall biosynthesis